jgi:predicted metal-binding membrane protein
MLMDHPNTGSVRRLYLVFGFLIVMAWGILVAWQRSAFAELLGHESLGDSHIPFVSQFSAILLSWFLMTVAMMLPGSLPVLIHFIQPGSRVMQSIQVVGWMIVGYVSPWVLFGVFAFLSDSVLHQLTQHGGPLAAVSNMIAPAIVLTAGLYQFTPLKRRCTALCRPPQSQTHSKNTGRAGFVKRGLQLGVFCVGSCWSLMLLMFALGTHRLDWMLALGVLLAAERLTRWGQRLSWWIGIVLVLWATLWLVNPPYLVH